ncbi:MAG: uncharacterized protein A8A55_0444 [Amphiamblys sp. WSBS2006]|nr:MAG: uncharacterized protein A8A55_0444 [Amphiamblys sp. WSBS2006]
MKFEEHIGKTYIEECPHGNYDRTLFVTRKDFPENSRIMNDSSAMTMDYIEDRLNVIYDDRNKIIKTYFG